MPSSTGAKVAVASSVSAPDATERTKGSVVAGAGAGAATEKPVSAAMPMTAAVAPATSASEPVPSDAVSRGSVSDEDGSTTGAATNASTPTASACVVRGRSEGSLVSMGGSVVVMVPAVSGRR
ncbi:hypothetical protein ACR8AL_12940 [Clavibacter sepedonicus]|uniref:hypothetical protein n=1 Tax=Clavibacter TaxID=1573 RepID=UPI00059C80FE|nr:hypothetical protein [Clavibacter sp.]